MYGGFGLARHSEFQDLYSMSTKDLIRYVIENLQSISQEHCELLIKNRYQTRISKEYAQQSQLLQVMNEIRLRLEFKPKTVLPNHFITLLDIKR